MTNTIKGRKHQIEVTAGLEIQLQFTSSENRRNIVNVGRSTGWRPRNNIEMNDEAWLISPSLPRRQATASRYNDRNDVTNTSCRLYVIIDRLWIPSDVIEECIPCFRELKRDNNLRLYARYKFYDQGWLRFDSI